jgi:hypothetical protein
MATKIPMANGMINRKKGYACQLCMIERVFYAMRKNTKKSEMLLYRGKFPLVHDYAGMDLYYG